MTNDSNTTDCMATIPVSICYLCGYQGDNLHADLSDPQSVVSGKWNLKRCSNPSCGFVWLDPMPAKEDIGKAYRVYFTHSDYAPEAAPIIDWLNLLFLKIHKPLYKFFEHAVGLRKVEKECRKKADLMFLGDCPPGGALLDVGCGRGDLLDRLHRQGWIVEGLDVDAEAVAYARMHYGLKVRLGALETHRFPDDAFDAVTMNHVIEHVYDPIVLIRECLRVLKPGGRLVLATPNIRSLGYKRFGRYWSPLDPPRHLYLFTKKNLKECTSRAGFRSIDVWCMPGYAEGGAIRVSIEQEEDASGKKRWAFIKWVEASYLKVLAYYLFFGKKNDEVGEEIFLVATKDK